MTDIELNKVEYEFTTPKYVAGPALKILTGFAIVDRNELEVKSFFLALHFSARGNYSNLLRIFESGGSSHWIESIFESVGLFLLFTFQMREKKIGDNTLQ